MREIVLVRHGETEWSAAGRHTSVTDLDLTPDGERRAALLAGRLAGRSFGLVLCSPRTRAQRTAVLAGLAPVVTDGDLAEWNYGDYEGLTTAQIREHDPAWTIWSGTTPGGETAAQVATRADRVLDRVRPVLSSADVCLVAHGHFLRVVTARWLGLPPRDGALFKLETATLSVLGYERDTPTLLQWNA
ncbi:histidine phosphatase family protein [Hamadaea tsunoensis]|uniref:histidine phosphatase family protein n=1 Tax=Hamadaea tsunoensis TaxID=53368 RepID=UPI000483CE41|nr:histidine phosphatase family protein [Hamadaea tsunoensis]